MDIQIGDKVRYLNLVGSGVVTKVIDSQLVEIRDESGFDIPVLKKELVIIEKGEKHIKSETIQDTYSFEKEEIKIAPTNEAIEKEKKKPSLLYAFTKTAAENIVMHLINDSNFTCLFTASFLDDGQAVLIDAGMLEPDTKISLGEKTEESINKFENISIQTLFFKKRQHTQETALQTKIKISKINFADINFKENDFFEKKALILNLTPSKEDKLKNISAAEIKKAMYTKNDIEKPIVNKAIKKDKNSVKEVDLHIHEIIEDERGLTPGDKLDIQIRHFKQELDKAVTEKLEKIVFIHGVGNGVLKMKIRSILDRDYNKLEYQDASFQQYKWGATMVYIK